MTRGLKYQERQPGFITMRHRNRKLSKNGITEVQKVVIVAVAILGGVAVVGWIVLSSFLTLSPVFPIGLGPAIEEIEEPRIAIIEGDAARIEFSTFNGLIRLEPTSSNELNITVIKRGIGPGIENIDIQFTESTDPNGVERVTLTARRINPALIGLNEGVSIEAQIPADIFYTVLELTSSNGRIEASELQGEELVARTSNGRIVLNEVEFQTIRADTSNGRVTGVIRSDDAEIQTSNGQIDLTLLGAGNYDLRTSNGRVNIVVSGDIPARVDAATSNAGVEWTGVPIILMEAGRSNLRAQTESFEAADSVLDILVRTSNSGVTIRSEL